MDEFSRNVSDTAYLNGEDRLNNILDKISGEGIDSLSDYERKFLEDYSSSLD